MVQRWPAVPAAPNTTARMAMSKSACSLTMTALFPPNSNKERPRRWATAVPTLTPMRVEPVADTNGMVLSLLINSPMRPSPMTRFKTPSGTSLSFNTLPTNW